VNPLKRYFKSHTTQAFRLAIRQVEEEWRICSLHRSSLKRVQQFLHGSPLKLNLGCGPNPKSGWVNVDLYDSRADLHLDLREPWPFPDGAACHVYSEHVFEHFEFHREVPHFLSESLRVLCTGGRFDVGVPDSEWPVRAYGDLNDYYWVFVEAVHPAWCKTRLEHLNYHFRQETRHKYVWEDEHRYAWDEETLASSIRKAGFTGVKPREFDASLDTESRRTGTLYMLAFKPEL
jgi:predicted SAM-dependent methyltransferase